jgi:hypothetical protein
VLIRIHVRLDQVESLTAGHVIPPLAALPQELLLAIGAWQMAAITLENSVNRQTSE